MIITVVLRENRAIHVLLRVVPDELNARAEDGRVCASHDDFIATFVPIWIGEGLPADVKRSQEEIGQIANRQGSEIPVAVARRITPGAREILGTGGISWADASGRAQISVPGRLYISRSDPIPVERPSAFSWSAAASAVAETLLTWRARQRRGIGEPIDRVGEIAEVAGVSVAHTARVLRQFDEQKYTVKTGAERGTSATRELRDPGRMLSDWAALSSYPSMSGQVVEFHVPWREIEDSYFPIVNAFAGWDWAVTSEAAAERIAHYLTNVPTLEVYVPAGQFSAMAARLSQEPDVTRVESGGRIRILAAEPYLFHLTDNVRGVPVASVVRVYADLLRHGGRSAEAAEHLREVAIGF